MAESKRHAQYVVADFCSHRFASFVRSIDQADNAEKVRAVIAITLVGVLIALQFVPTKNKTLTASAETLAIAVVAFYFGLHSGVDSWRQSGKREVPGTKPPAAGSGSS